MRLPLLAGHFEDTRVDLAPCLSPSAKAPQGLRRSGGCRKPSPLVRATRDRVRAIGKNIVAARADVPVYNGGKH
jgi:hypothetical protein